MLINQFVASPKLNSTTISNNGNANKCSANKQITKLKY
jgi:hypothetical protein